jgi:hypothetical protein
VFPRLTLARLYIHLSISSYNISIQFLLAIGLEALVTISLCKSLPVISLSAVITNMLCRLYDCL